MDKAPDAFRTISEVAEDLDLPQHVLRFWETRFSQIKPLKRGGGRRYYRPDDIDLLRGIRHLLYGKGYTIKGVQRILKDEGLKFVQSVWKDGAPPPQIQPDSAKAAYTEVDDGKELYDEPATAFLADDDDALPPTPPALPRTAPEPAAPAARQPEFDRFRERAPQSVVGGMHPVEPARQAQTPPQAGPRELRLSVEPVGIRRLQAALYELGECRRVLANARADAGDLA